MRGSHENASLYWLGRMLEGGEDPLYVARRLVRFASEDVGTGYFDTYIYILGHLADVFIQSVLQPFTHRRWSQLRKATASSSGAVGMRCLAQGHLDTPSRGSN